MVWPALGGPFVLDDQPNLSPLAVVNKTGDIWAFTLTGVASAIGRPLSYLTFALQAASWPDNPSAFKSLNLSLHIFNSFLVYLVCICVFTCRGEVGHESRIKSSIIAMLWLTIPIHTSTVFYVVQRMTILSASFTLIGILAYLHSYEMCRQRREYRSLVLLLLGTALGYFGGILSKETGILLGVFILSIHSFLLPKLSSFSWNTALYVVSLGPLLLLVGYACTY